jgi:putative flippase GtrA
VTASNGEQLSLPMRFGAFVLVGGACLALNTLTLWLLTSLLGIHYLASTAIAVTTITPFGFLLNKVLTFRTHRRYAKMELPRYCAVLGVSFAANLALMYLLVSLLGMWYLLASVLVAVLLVIANFVASDRWSFRVRH